MGYLLTDVLPAQSVSQVPLLDRYTCGPVGGTWGGGIQKTAGGAVYRKDSAGGIP